MRKTDRADDYSPAAVHAEFMKVLGRLARGRPADHAFLKLCEDEFTKQRNTKAKRFCMEKGALYAESCCSPAHTGQFAAVLFQVLRRLYGGETIWENKRPRDAKLADAKRMTPAEMMKTGISRSHAYALRREALRRK